MILRCWAAFTSVRRMFIHLDRLAASGNSNAAALGWLGMGGGRHLGLGTAWRRGWVSWESHHFLTFWANLGRNGPGSHYVDVWLLFPQWIQVLPRNSGPCFDLSVSSVPPGAGHSRSTDCLGLRYINTFCPVFCNYPVLQTKLLPLCIYPFRVLSLGFLCMEDARMSLGWHSLILLSLECVLNHCCELAECDPGLSLRGSDSQLWLNLNTQTPGSFKNDWCQGSAPDTQIYLIWGGSWAKEC